MRWPGAPRIDLDWPIPGTEIAGALEIVGWAFSSRAAIERIEATFAGAPPVQLAHGKSRPDVAERHGCDAACGFAGLVPLDALPTGPLTLTVTAIDRRGGRAARSVSVVRRESLGVPAEAGIEIDRVTWRGPELEVLGCALAPSGSAWRSIVIEVDGAVAGVARRGLSRPELRGRFPASPEAVRSGFHFRGNVPLAGELALVAETPDGRRLRRALARPQRADEGVAGGELGRLLERLRHELERDATVLDATGLGLAAELPGELVVTPLDPAVLPYVENSFDVVAIDGDQAGRVALARRLANRAVVLAQPKGALRLLWRAESVPSRLPPVSVVIPAFNQSACTDACVRSVLETWPDSLEGEVLVVDDGSSDDTPELLARWSQRDRRVRALPQPENRGFVAACNAGAAAARGEVLVFLNNDTLAQPGWLPPLLAALERERAGAVGGKLLYPGGTLQEAGGVVFSDGDGCNFGKGDREPDHPLFEHVREVDYCSGALLATPRALFLSLGGFDAAYAPAYYEDADYAFRLRQHGYRVYYQPASVIVHLEGKTAGRDLTTGVKRHQVANRKTFVARWADALGKQPPPPRAMERATLHELHARGRDTRRALVVLPTMPELDREGGSRRAFHLIVLLLEAGWAVSVVVENATGGERYARALRQLGAAVYAGQVTRGAGADYLPELAELLRLERFDLALLAFWHVAERHLPALRALSPRTRVLVDSIDLHFLRESRAAFAGARRDGRLDVLGGRYADEFRRELNAYGAADGVLAVSTKEAGWIDDLLGSPGHGLCVPLLEHPRGPARPLEERRGLVFLGNFRHPPNVDALAFLGNVVARLDPAVLARHPLAIVGNALEARMLGPLAGNPHVHAVGWVPAVEPYLERARVSLVPLRQGAGTKAKMIQSLLAGTACVSTTLGIEGMGLAHGSEVLVADPPDAFAAAVERLLSDDEAWRQLARQGRAAIERNHGREAVRALFLAALDSVLTRPAGRGGAQD